MSQNNTKNADSYEVTSYEQTFRSTDDINYNNYNDVTFVELTIIVFHKYIRHVIYTHTLQSEGYVVQVLQNIDLHIIIYNN